MSIRLRVTLTAVVVAAIAVGAADAASFALLNRYLHGRATSSVRTIAQTAAAATSLGRPLSLDLFAADDRPVLVELRGRDGRVLQRLGSAEDARLVPRGLASHPGRAESVGGDGPPRFEAIAIRDRHGRTVVAVISLAAELTTLHHLIAIDFWVGVVVLAALAAVATIVLGRSLRPLLRIATTADAIAAGNLAERVPAAPPRTEIGRVSSAINRMLEEIETAFAQRDATEQRLRQFLADASHELRTPLTSIRGYAELFRRGADRRPEDLARAMTAIEHEGARMSRLVEDLLLLARLDDARPLERGPVAVDGIVEAAVEAARVVDPTRSFGFELAERPLTVEGDARRLRQILDNLLANVRQHTPAGSSAYVIARRDGDQVVVVVEDDGPGVPAADRERVFDRFYRPHDGRPRDYGSAGLGLAIVRSLVLAQGGTIALGDARPHGARFEIRLPAGDSRATPRFASGPAEAPLVPFPAEPTAPTRETRPT